MRVSACVEHVADCNETQICEERELSAHIKRMFTAYCINLSAAIERGFLIT